MALNKFFKGKSRQAKKNLFGPSATQQAGFGTQQSPRFPTLSTARRKALRSGPRTSAIPGM